MATGVAKKKENKTALHCVVEKTQLGFHPMAALSIFIGRFTLSK